MSTKYGTNNHNSKRNATGRSTSDRNNTTSISSRKSPVPRMKKQRRVHPAVKAFFLTLAIVVGVGMVIVLCISLPRYLKAHKTEEFSLSSFVEAIPETLTENNGISLPDNAEEPTEAESKYDDLRNYPDYLAENNIFFKDAHKEGEVTLGFTGDVLLDDEYAVMAALIQRGNNLESSITPDTLKTMNDMDIMVINNEFPFTEGGTRQADKQYTFRADYSTAPYLQQMGVDAAILANNHVFDFGEQGLLDTLKTMDDLGIQPLGAGRNITEAMTPTYYIVNDIKIALIAATDIERLDYPDTRAATEDSAGVLRSWNNNEQLVEIIKNARENADFVIVCIHWGTGVLGSGSQIDMIYPLLVGAVPEEMAGQVKETLKQRTAELYHGHMAVGLVGVPVLAEWAARVGEADFVYGMLKQPDYPGYLNMISNGATGTWESWDGDRSRFHNCYNGIGSWFYQALGGIIADEPGYRHVTINPQRPEGLEWVKVTKETPYGTIRVEWDSKSMDVWIPSGVTATCLGSEIGAGKHHFEVNF